MFPIITTTNPLVPYPLQLTLTLEDLGIPVDIDYDATLEDAAAKLAEGKASDGRLERETPCAMEWAGRRSRGSARGHRLGTKGQLP